MDNQAVLGLVVERLGIQVVLEVARPDKLVVNLMMEVMDNQVAPGLVVERPDSLAVLVVAHPDSQVVLVVERPDKLVVNLMMEVMDNQVAEHPDTQVVLEAEHPDTQVVLEVARLGTQELEYLGTEHSLWRQHTASVARNSFHLVAELAGP